MSDTWHDMGEKLGAGPGGFIYALTSSTRDGFRTDAINIANVFKDNIDKNIEKFDEKARSLMKEGFIGLNDAIGEARVQAVEGAKEILFTTDFLLNKNFEVVEEILNNTTDDISQTVEGILNDTQEIIEYETNVLIEKVRGEGTFLNLNVVHTTSWILLLISAVLIIYFLMHRRNWNFKKKLIGGGIWFSIIFISLWSINFIFERRIYNDHVKGVETAYQHQFDLLNFKTAFIKASVLNNFLIDSDFKMNYWKKFKDKHKVYRGKAELAYKLFEQNGSLNNTQIRKLKNALDELNSIPYKDPDVLTMNAFINWRQGDSKLNEYYAAMLCANALKLNDKFALKPLAINYLRNFSYNFYDLSLENDNDLLESFEKLNKSQDLDFYSIKELYTLNERFIDYIPEVNNKFTRVTEVNNTIISLYKNVVPAYLEMLHSHVELRLTNSSSPKIKSLKEERGVSASSIIKSFHDFRDRYKNQIDISINYLYFNDAIYTKAIYIYNNPSTTYETLSPLYFNDKNEENSNWNDYLPIRVEMVEPILSELKRPLIKNLFYEDQILLFNKFDTSLYEFEESYYILANYINNTEDNERVLGAFKKLIEKSYQINLVVPNSNKGDEIYNNLPEYVHQLIHDKFKIDPIIPFEEVDVPETNTEIKRIRNLKLI